MIERRNLDRFGRFLKSQENQNPYWMKITEKPNIKMFPKIIKDLGMIDGMFYSASLRTLRIWSIKINNRPDFKKRMPDVQACMLNTFNSFLAFCYSIEGQNKRIVIVNATDKDSDNVVILWKQKNGLLPNLVEVPVKVKEHKKKKTDSKIIKEKKPRMERTSIKVVKEKKHKVVVEGVIVTFGIKIIGLSRVTLSQKPLLLNNRNFKFVMTNLTFMQCGLLPFVKQAIVTPFKLQNIDCDLRYAA